MKTESTPPASSEQQGPSKIAMKYATKHYPYANLRPDIDSAGGIRRMFAEYIDTAILEANQEIRLQLEQAEKTAALAGEMASVLNEMKAAFDDPEVTDSCLEDIAGEDERPEWQREELRALIKARAMCSRYAATKGTSP